MRVLDEGERGSAHWQEIGELETEQLAGVLLLELEVGVWGVLEGCELAGVVVEVPDDVLDVGAFGLCDVDFVFVQKFRHGGNF